MNGPYVANEAGGGGLANDTSVNSPHVVLLGAGASRAACPTGDANGRKLPVLSDIVEIVGVGADLPEGYDTDDFERLYSSLALDPHHAALCRRIESRIHEYFSGLTLPDTPTIYDYLVLSLRPKDVIATFNWDPFLLQAVQRAYRKGTRPPELLFLHGCVAVGCCLRDRREGPLNQPCSACGQDFAPSQLLYPVAEKNYTDDTQISEAWNYLQRTLQRAFMVTVFGYSAPKSDAAAIELLKNGWGSAEDRQLEKFEIIDIRDPEELRATWDEFIHTHHYEIHDNFFDSFMAKYPRRTGESFWRQNLDAAWVEPTPAPRGVTLDALRRWYIPLHDAEMSPSRR
jgi:hypothetical protein